MRLLRLAFPQSNASRKPTQAIGVGFGLPSENALHVAVTSLGDERDAGVVV
jgi:hypothetical protein